MTKFNVLLCPIVSVKVKDIEAETYEEAVNKVLETLNLDEFFRAVNEHVTHDSIEYIEATGDMPYALVDVQGDEEEYKLSRWVNFDKRFCIAGMADMFSKLALWASNVSEHFGAPNQLVCECMDALRGMFKDLRLQKGKPGEEDPFDSAPDISIYSESGGSPS